MTGISISQQAEEAALSAREYSGQTDALRAKREAPPAEVFALRKYRQARKDALAESMARWAAKVEARGAAK